MKVKHLDGVSNASVNFGASKLTALGETTIEELEKAVAFENIKLIPEKQKFYEISLSLRELNS